MRWRSHTGAVRAIGMPDVNGPATTGGASGSSRRSSWSLSGARMRSRAASTACTACGVCDRSATGNENRVGPNVSTTSPPRPAETEESSVSGWTWSVRSRASMTFAGNR
jgi:hypothetical protein